MLRIHYGDMDTLYDNVGGAMSTGIWSNGNSQKEIELKKC